MEADPDKRQNPIAKAIIKWLSGIQSDNKNECSASLSIGTELSIATEDGKVLGSLPHFHDHCRPTGSISRKQLGNVLRNVLGNHLVLYGL
jgi:hypothetical protein